MKVKFTEEGVNLLKSFSYWRTAEGDYYNIPVLFKATEESDVFETVDVKDGPFAIRRDMLERILSKERKREVSFYPLEDDQPYLNPKQVIWANAEKLKKKV